jgi:hypothetical protein
MDLYKLHDKVSNGHVYAEVRKGMYGLPQAGRLAYEKLRLFLEPHGYVPCTVTPGLWKHLDSDLMFSLVVDDFGVRYTDRADVDRLISVLKQAYKLTTDWTGARYIGLTLEWDYKNGHVDVSMPGYIQRALIRFAHRKPRRPQHSPHEWTAPVYGARQQFATHDTTDALSPQDVKRVQEVLGTFLYYARAVDCTMLASIGSIASQQANATQMTLQAINQLLDYAATHPDAVVRFYSSDMVLHVETDASYLSETKARSRVAGYHYLSTAPSDPTKAPLPDAPSPPLNGPINVVCKIMREVLSSAAEAELGGLFYNGKEAVPERITLEELGHTQPPTPIVTDNSTATGIANDCVKQKRSKAMDMRFYWIRDRVRQGQFIVHWKRGSSNRADYFTKHHPAKHHQQQRLEYLQRPSPVTAANYYAALCDDPPPSSNNPSPSRGEGVLIPCQRAAPALPPMLARHARRASLSARRVAPTQFKPSRQI